MVKKPIRSTNEGPTKRRTKKPPSWEYEKKTNPTPVAKRSRGPAPKYQWSVIRDEYVEGYLKDEPKDEFDRIFPTYEELSKRHGASVSAIRQRGSTERWKNLKNQYAIELVQARQKKRSNKLANAAVTFDDNALRVGELGITLVMSRLAEIGKEMPIRQAIRDNALADLQAGHEINKDDLRSAVYHQEMMSLANAAEKFQQIGMRALGTSADVNNNITNVQIGDTNVGNTVNVSQELVRDDKERMSEVISSFVEAGSLPRNFIEALETSSDIDKKEIIDAEVVEDESDLEGEETPYSEAVPDPSDVEDDEYEPDPEILNLINAMPKVNVTSLDSRMKSVREESSPVVYPGSDYDIDPSQIDYSNLNADGEN